MERKSIGSFIAALRKSNGMTQKMLAERLNVSDKAVSRWERDECAPDLSLIPVIAEIFNVTADELLCGERRNPNVTPSNPNARTEKQKQRLLNNAYSKFRNLSLISLGISSAAVITAVIIEIIFQNYPVTLLFTTIVVIASVICEITFIGNLLNSVSEEEFDDIKTDSLKIKAIDFSRFIFAVNYWIVFVVVALQFYLPFCTGHGNYSLYDQFFLYSDRIFSFESVVIAFVYSAVGFVIFKTVWNLILKKLQKSGIYPVDESNQKLLSFKRKFLIIFSSVLILTVFLQGFVYNTDQALFVQPLQFNDVDSFRSYAADSGNDPIEIEVFGFSIISSGYNSGNSSDEIVSECDDVLTDSDGNILLEFAHNNADIAILGWDEENLFPIEVTTHYQLAKNEIICRMLFAVIIILELLVMLIVYRIMSKAKMKKLGIIKKK